MASITTTITTTEDLDTMNITHPITIISHLRIHITQQATLDAAQNVTEAAQAQMLVTATSVPTTLTRTAIIIVFVMIIGLMTIVVCTRGLVMNFVMDVMDLRLLIA